MRTIRSCSRCLACRAAPLPSPGMPQATAAGLKAAVASSHGSSFASYARVVHAQCSTRPFHRRQTSLPLGNSAVSGSAPTFMRSPKESRRSTGAVFASSHRRLRVDSLLKQGLLARRMNCRSRSRSHSRVFCFSLMLHLQKRLYDIVLRPTHQKQEETYSRTYSRGAAGGRSVDWKRVEGGAVFGVYGRGERARSAARRDCWLWRCLWCRGDATGGGRGRVRLTSQQGRVRRSGRRERQPLHSGALLMN